LPRALRPALRANALIAARWVRRNGRS